VLGPITTVVGLGKYEDTSFLASLIIIITYLFNDRRLTYDKELYYILAPVILLVIFVGIVFFLRGGIQDLPMQLFMRSVRIVITIVSAYFVAKLLSTVDYNYTLYRFEWVFFLLVVFHALLMLMMMIEPEIRSFVYQYTNAGGEEIDKINLHGRMAGLFGAGGAYVSVFQSFGVVLGLFYSERIHGVRLYFLHLMVFVVIASTIISGRTGFYISIIFLIYFVFRNLRYNSQWVVKLFTVLFFLSITVGSYLSSMLDSDLSLQWVVTRTFKTLTVLFETGVLHDVTVSHLISQYKLHDEILTYLIGLGSDLGYYGRYFSSDIGYLKYISAFGVMGSVIAVLPYLYMMHLSIITKSHALFYLIILSLIVHAKEVFLFGRAVFPLVVILFFVQLIIYKREKNKSSILHSG